MTPLKSILVIVDPYASAHPALEKSATLARRTGASLELFICHYDQYLSGTRFFDSPGLEKARENAIELRRNRLEKLAEPLRQEGIDVSCDVVWDNPLDEGIVRKTQQSEPDLVLKSTEYHHGLGRALFTHTDWNLIRHLSTPLLLVKPATWHKGPVLIAAVDPMHEHDKPASLDHKIIGAAQDMGHYLSGDVHLFHALPPVITPPAGVAPEAVALPVDAVENNLEKLHLEAITGLAADHDIAKNRCHMMIGKTRQELRDLVQGLDAGIVVMGAVARNPWARVFIGSTAEKALDRIPCDLLVVKPDQFVTPVEAKPLLAAEKTKESAMQISI